MKDKPIILIVDDQIQNIELLDAYLVPQGYDIITAVTGKEALDKLSRNQIDLILLDIMMPGMDGFEVIRRIRLEPAYQLLPIILITALRETADRVKGIESGCDDFISKPVDRMELLARVRSLLKVKAYNDLLNNYRKELESEVASRTKELADINSGLEKKVKERTEELENEKYKLKERNEIMENDLDMARSIQKCFIPDKSPAAYISFHYKPMEKVGGDFFDFIRITGNGSIGIFISDVSGHGVPAAFITAMVKSSILQFSSFYNSPSSVLEILNNILINQSADNFITAFYGIYNPDTRDFTYSSAGHNPPYILNNENLEYLNIKSHAPPLAVMNNMELQALNKEFINETIVLKKGSKMILYTDGLTESININDKKYIEEKNFENKILHDSFRTHFNKPAEQFINGIYQDLVDLRGCDDFEDDVCIICVDIE